MDNIPLVSNFEIDLNRHSKNNFSKKYKNG
jgi:hypothetical protein